ncbi:MAG: helix-turn-helix transcriptional regulator [Hyphomicrobiaceae bacterium]
MTNKLEAYIGRRIGKRRTDIGLSPDKLAQMTGCSGPEITEIELGHRRASAQTLADLAGALGVEVGFFFEGIDAVELETSPLNQVNSATVIPFNRKPAQGIDQD